MYKAKEGITMKLFSLFLNFRKPKTMPVENETTMQKFHRLATTYRKKPLTKAERLWIAQTFGLEQFIKEIYTTDDKAEQMVIMSDKQLIASVKKKTDNNNDGRLPWCY